MSDDPVRPASEPAAKQAGTAVTSSGGIDRPPLPPVRGAGLAHVVIPGMVLWLIALIVLLLMIPYLREHDAMLWLWTALAGFILGFFGLAVYAWQRSAARRGSKGASSMALEEQIRAPRSGG